MDFSLEPEYTREHEEFAGEVREWLDKNVSEGLVRLRDPIKMSREQWEKRRELGRKLGEKGWLHPEAPRQYGGGGLDAERISILSRELDKKGISLPLYYDVGPTLAAAAILVCGTEEQKQRLLPPIYKGEVVTWQLFTEPEAGTDEANNRLTPFATFVRGAIL